MTTQSHRDSDNNDSDAEKSKRDAEFLKQEKSEKVPSGIRPDLAKPGPDGAGGDGGGVGSSI